ncbi:hypothetical protein J1605_016103 [Eschrichtius robustus]|uniref:Uncharacterized protein n=1 Tax=Eschrichtius robustus TaxID=9764 RepID=A0AB34G844_ESCRO|nr:hypothetical protein J1605_016103 [Eschrichtius robustus]
MRTVGELWWAR